MQGGSVEVKIGVQDTAREIVLESEETPEAISKAVDAAISNGSLLSLTDDRGRMVIVPATKIAYVEISPASSRRVGFGH
jgi:hypothetical protein